MESYYKIGRRKDIFLGDDEYEILTNIKYTGEQIMKMDVADVWYIYKIYVPLIDGKPCQTHKFLLYDDSFPMVGSEYIGFASLDRMRMSNELEPIDIEIIRKFHRCSQKRKRDDIEDD
uniref:Uncharacterized protein n=1 Tax=viral metagenome TaxID=1070528 RepID=A0A6C0EB66_9ZZZZ